MLTIQDTQKNNSFVAARKQTEEYKRLQEVREQNIPWKKWGPYLSDRQWATVREDYSQDGNAWNYFTHDHARSRAYRWGEDGILGISDERQHLCFAISLWNSQDTILKERFFGLTESEGNHGEDVKEYYFYLDNNPTHSYMKALYKYPYKFPYDKLVEENRKRRDAKDNRGEEHPEYELIDTNCFGEGYFDVVVEYAKKTPEDILIKITVWNRSSKAHPLHILPTLWFRNTWSWLGDAEREKQKPSLQRVLEKTGNNMVIKARHSELGDYYLYCQGDTPLLFTENETNNERIFHTPNASRYVKDGINNYVVNQELDKVNPEQKGTKAAAHYNLTIEANESQVIWLRLTDVAPDQLPDANPFGSDFEEVFDKRKEETDAFYQAITPSDFQISDEERQVQRQAFAGMLWNKQFYYYIVQDWLKGDWSYQERKWHKIYPPQKTSEHIRNNDNTRNQKWTHLHNEDIISMPDKWEYPWYAVWDSAFHAVTFALIDPDFAKEQLCLFLEDWYIHPNGQLPSFEWNFSEGNPPIHAWGAWQVYQIEKRMYGFSDKDFLRKIFHKLNSNFNWWLEVQKIPENNLFSGGFLGLDNISLINRSHFKNDDVKIEQADGTSWMAMFSLNMLRIAIELGSQDPSSEEIEAATMFLKEFLNIANAINDMTEKNGTHLWDQKDEFYYDILSIVQENLTLEFPLKYRSLVGLIPLCAIDIFESESQESQNQIIDAFKSKFSDPNSLSQLFLPGTDFNYLRGKYESFYIADKHNSDNLEMYLSIVDFERLQLIVKKLLDKQEFLSDYGIRSLSKIHDPNSEFGSPYSIPCFMKDKHNSVLPSRILYEPGEAGKCPVHTGNSNWRGPIWFPVNFLIIDSLYKFHDYIHDCLGDEFKVEFPTGERGRNTLKQVAVEISKRLIRIFLLDGSGKRPVYGDNPKLRELFKTPDGQDLILFYEYFHGDTGQGLGASHQTGWTGLVANLIYQVGEYNHK
ncbi:MAG: glucosidase [Microcystis panniformis Mp_GB_SS_20050300_S99D]|nr:MAG: glucosidase [Microcystis panniformis Mp_GB_SS_20050300_S99D]TRV47748.1 MAG: glucosidase [Microcystis panniformis Mp_MB_F_20080800_S26D]TRV50768.1 MAG: glucosidase [Microcystis panniformis Mp_GB_SS_20050300_S99]TRV60557.1 MAG: glucosidase [Microcystis panniformis Mp_MB_F_20080800_S26]